MKWLLPFTLCLTLLSVSFVQAPRMTVRNGDHAGKLLRLETARVSVKLIGDVAETSLDLEFRNDGERAVEGEFALALPEGATVSRYALDVNGTMRAGVVVEKERARNAYESVKRRMIDPGIVEREAGNIYRTKVYPVPAHGTKRLSICYLETLRTSTRGLDYSLPLGFHEALLSFTCEIHASGVGEIKFIDNAGLHFLINDSLHKVELQNAKPRGVLKLALTPSAKAQMIVANQDQPAFYLSDPMPDTAPRARPSPETVLLVWDASASARDRDHKKEFAILEAWFAKLGTTRVKLKLLRNTVESGGEFEIRDGNWQKLKTALQQVDYDGATFLAGVKVPANDADLVLLVSDGISTLGSGRPEIAVPWVLMHAGKNEAAQSFLQWSTISAEAVIDLSKENSSQALTKLTKQSLRLIDVTGDGLENFLVDPPTQPGERQRVFGTLKSNRAGQLSLRYGFGKQVTTTREVAYQPGGDADDIVRRLYAQRLLTALEQEEPRNANRIIDHCKKESLVSDYTSFIVLELLQDYADHGIRPPEPELHQEYQRLVDALEARRKIDLGGLAYAWSCKLAWHDKRFPGYEASILPRLKQVGIWKKAVESQFPPAQRDDKAFTTIAGWYDAVSGLLREKAKVRTKDDYDQWKKSLDALQQQGAELSKTPLTSPPAGKAFAVSVRGLVALPGVVTVDAPLTLREAIAKAGGLHPSGSWDNVALYRNAGKIIYNTLSEQYKDVPLYPGDMVVVGHSSSYWEGTADPFAAEPEPRDFSKEAAVREEGDVWIDPSVSVNMPEPTGGGYAVAPLSADAFPVTPATPTSFRRFTPAPSVRITEQAAMLQPRRIEGQKSGVSPEKDAAVSPSETPDFAAFEKALAAGLAPDTAYRKLKAGHLYEDRFYIEVARLLFAQKHESLALRVLSNIIEFRPGDRSAIRAYAFWLSEFGQVRAAVGVLEPLTEDDPTALPPRLDLASIYATGGKSHLVAETLLPVLETISSGQSGSMAAFALTEFNAYCQESSMYRIPWRTDRYEKNLPADIRIVATSTGADSSLHFEVQEPDGAVFSSVGSVTSSGGLINEAGGRREYMLRRALPGVYQIRCSSDHPATLRLVIHTRWGHPDQQTRVVTLLLDEDRLQQVGELEFEFLPTAKSE